MEIRKISRRRWRSSDYAELRHFAILVCRGRQLKKCTKIYNARAQLLFSSLNLLTGGGLVAVVVVVCLGAIYTVRLCCTRQATTGLQHELFRVNQTYNLLTTVVYVKKIAIGF